MSEHELARALAKMEHHRNEAIEELATGRVDTAHYHMNQAFLALGDYLIEADDWVVTVPDDSENDTTSEGGE